MLVLAFAISFFICIFFSLINVKFEKRSFHYSDIIIGLVLFCILSLFQICVYSNPGITIGFGKFRFIFVCTTSLWASVCICAFRLRHLFHNKIYMISLIVFFSIGAESLICNIPYFSTHNYNPVDLTSYITSDSGLSQDGDMYLITDKSLSISMERINKPIYNLQLTGLSYITEATTYNEQNTAMEIEVYATDEAHQVDKKLSQTNWYVSNLEESTHTTSVWLSGEAESLTLKINAVNDTPIDYRLQGITANVNRPFSFSLVRFLIITGLLFLIFAFCPSSVLWKQKYLDNRKKYRPLVVISAGLMIIVAIVIPQANPSLNGIATKDWNSDQWNGTSRYNFYSYYGPNYEYSELANSLLHGQFHLMDSPSEELQATENPYDSDALNDKRIQYKWDYAYYDGEYYVYFGIIPCLLFQVPYEILTGKQDLVSWVNVMVMGIIFILVVFALIKQVIRRWFPSTSVAVYFLSCGAIIFGTQFINILCRPHIYEVAIISGVVCMLLGLWQWLLAANTSDIQENHVKIMFHMALGSLFVAMVAGCRPQILIFAFLCLPIFWHRYITDKRLFTRFGIIEMIAFAFPVGVVALGLMYYNAARFNSPFDFGANYNITSNDMTKRGFNPWRIGTAMLSDFFQPPSITAVFPFLKTVSVETNLIGTHIVEAMQGGLITCTPITWAMATIPSLNKRIKEKGNGLFAIICYLIGASIALAIVDAQMAGVLRRYIMDFSPMLILASIICVMVIEEALKSQKSAIFVHLSNFYRVALLSAVLFSLIYRFCTMFMAVDANYSVNNPAFYAYVSRLVQFWL